LDEDRKRAATDMGVPFTFPLPDAPREVVVHMQQGVLLTGSPVLDGAQDEADRLAAMAAEEGETYQLDRLLDFEGKDLGGLLQLLVGSEGGGPFARFSVRRSDLDLFELASLPSQPEDFPPVTDLKRVFQQLAAFWQWRNKEEQEWSEGWAPWLMYLLADKLIEDSGGSKDPRTVREALAKMETWDPGWISSRQKTERQKVLEAVLAALPNPRIRITDETLKQDDECGRVKSILRDLYEGLQVTSEPVSAPVTDGDLDELTVKHLEPLRNIVGKGGLVDSMVGRYERAILAQRREYLSVSGWLETLSAGDDTGKYLALAPATLSPAAQREAWKAFIDAVSAARADAQLW
jgi:hypothetical protein